MNKTTISIPEGIYYLGNYPHLVAQLPQGRYILNKVMTGCGATTMFLADNTPTVLCSPRCELIRCKAESSQFNGLVHSFGAGITSGDNLLLQKISAMKMYVMNHQSNPFSPVPQPKILVTYDSAKHVIQGLSEMGILEHFRFVVDEFQTVFTDSAFRGDVEAEFMENLQYISNVVFLSATPYIEQYLDQLEEFNTLPYVELEWPDSSKHATNIQRERYHNGSQAQTAKDIISRYRQYGYFEESMDAYGNPQYATQAVFFVNDIHFILGTVKKNGLTQKDTNIICADNDDNRAKLKKYGFTIGHAPGEGEPHPTFTFVTKASFEGTDFYSPCAYTYIFSNIKRETLGVDISLDLPQIMGRQRLDSNPFKYSATFFYTTMMDYSEDAEREYMERIQAKHSQTQIIVNDYERCTDLQMKAINATKYRNSQMIERYQNDYVSVVDDRISHKPKVVFNNYVMLNEIRAWEVQRSQYIDNTYVMESVDNAFALNSPKMQSMVRQFLSSFSGHFEKRMQLYAEFLVAHPECKDELQGCINIPNTIKTYYNTLGYERLKALSWKEADIIAEMSRSEPDLLSSLSTNIRVAFPPGWYSLKDIKTTLQAIYDQLNLTYTAKATDIEQYLNCRPSKRTVKGERLNGYDVGE